MMALGSSPKNVILIVVLETLALGAVASTAGIALGMAAVGYHMHVGFDLSIVTGKDVYVGAYKIGLLIYPVFRVVPFLKSVLVTFAFVLIAGLYPAIRASRLNAADCMRSS